ncbi:MAG: lipoprotein, partial [Fibrobacter sp.]|nr:lipoprotein [Fibrobacter sp.]
MKRLFLLLFAVILLTSCANKSMTRYETLAPTLEKKGFEATIAEVKKEKDDLYGSNSEFLY